MGVQSRDRLDAAIKKQTHQRRREKGDTDTDKDTEKQSHRNADRHRHEDTRLTGTQAKRTNNHSDTDD